MQSAVKLVRETLLCSVQDGCRDNVLRRMLHLRKLAVVAAWADIMEQIFGSIAEFD
jgi:hypothetical protein